MPIKVIIIGSGVSSLTSASFLANERHSVTIIEKNKEIGGRARKFSSEGFTFDMGSNNFYYTDRLTVPGIEVPLSMVSGEVFAKNVLKHHS